MPPAATLARADEVIEQHTELLSDEEIKDIGLEPPTRDFDIVKAFWMP